MSDGAFVETVAGSAGDTGRYSFLTGPDGNGGTQAARGRPLAWRRGGDRSGSARMMYRAQTDDGRRPSRAAAASSSASGGNAIATLVDDAMRAIARRRYATASAVVLTISKPYNTAQ